MNLSDYKKDAFRTAGPYATNKALAALGLLTEMAEFINSPSVDEAGDVLWHIVVLDIVSLEDIRREWTKGDKRLLSDFEFVRLVEQMDNLKKYLASDGQKNTLDAEGAVIRAVRVIGRYPLEEVIAFNVGKRAKRYPHTLQETP